MTTGTSQVVDLGEAVAPHGDHVVGLDGLRGLAALAVVATHVGFATGWYGRGTVGALLSRLEVGVAVFFALSGFLLSRPWLLHRAQGAPRPKTAAYLWRRALRVLPAYWVAVVAGLALLPSNHDVTAVDWVRHLLLVQVYWPDWNRDGLSQMWSLCTEAAFYVALPALMALLPSARRTRSPGPPLVLALGMTLLGLVATGLASGADPVLPGQAGLWLPAHAGWFGVGIAFAAVSAQRAADGDVPRRLRPLVRAAAQPGSCWALAAALMWLATTPLAGPVGLEATPTGEAVTAELLYGAIAALLLLPLALPTGPNLLRTALDSAPLRRLGDLSYGIFLYHLVLLVGVRSLLDQPLFTGDFWQTMLLTTAAAWVAAAVSRRVLERPLGRLRPLVSAARPLPQQPPAGTVP